MKKGEHEVGGLYILSRRCWYLPPNGSVSSVLPSIFWFLLGGPDKKMQICFATRAGTIHMGIFANSRFYQYPAFICIKFDDIITNFMFCAFSR